MRKFLIQKENDYLLDFCNQTVEAINYLNWYNGQKTYDYKIISMNTIFQDIDFIFKGYIPVGSIEFVLTYYKRYYNIDDIKPICIPDELNKEKYLLRKVGKGSDIADFDLNKPLFIKNISAFKKETIIDYMRKSFENDRFLISECIDIKSEWRGFVLNGDLLDIRCYSGDFTIFPNVDIIYDMIKDYTEAPKAYTIDVAVTERGTVLIEIHQFFSCGLYGFNDNKRLIHMTVQNHLDIIKNRS